jgi:L-ribulose-5-phosphate 3-epimerase
MLTRRLFVQCTAAATAWGEQVLSQPALSAQTSTRALRLGVIAHGSDADAAIARVRRLTFSNCQVYLDHTDAAAADSLRQALDKYQIEATSLIITGPGPEIYDFVHGPATIGLVPREYRAARLARMKLGSDFAKRLGIPGIQGHCGFVPENPNDPLFGEVVQALKEVAAYCKLNGQTFRCETGQETPITLLRAIRAAGADNGLDNIGVNFDAANLILYGKANPVDAVDILGPYILGVHAKDGRYPTDPSKLGEEVPIGQGQVDFPRLIRRLKELKYRGPITIEREISGPRQDEDIRASKTYLERLIG